MHHINNYNSYPGFVPPPVPVRPVVAPHGKKPLHPAKSKVRRSKTGLVIFLIFLVLLAGAAATILALRQAGPMLDHLPLWSFPPSVESPGDWENWTPEEDETPTTIERGANVDYVVVRLQEPAGPTLSFQEIYQKCIPSIVSVLTTSDNGGGTGSGVVLTADGYIVTNYHVIQGGSSVDVVLHDGKSYPALLVGGDQTEDLAVLKINAGRLLTPAEFGDSDLLHVGDVALAIGNPLGEELRGTMTEGIVSAINRDVRMDGNVMSLIQTSAAINPGNSGGALINGLGQVVGITNMKMMSDYNTIEGLGFAIPSATVKTVAEDLLTHGHIPGRPTLGFVGHSISKAEAEKRGLEGGIYVRSVEPKSDAKKQGLQPGDVVFECEGTPVFSVDAVNAIKLKHSHGDVLHFRVDRDGKKLDLDITLMERWELDR